MRDRVVVSTDATALRVEQVQAVHYSIHNLAEPAFSARERVLSSLLAGRAVVVVADGEIMRLHGRRLLRYFSDRTRLLSCMTMPGEERLKEWAAVESICTEAARCGLDRSGVLVAVGGGVVMDTVGLAAALYRRGIRYVRVPTTLIGMVDVAVGIKQAVNLHGKKNLIGSFYPALAAVVDPRFLRTLDRRHIAGGLAEIVKVALVRDPGLFELVEAAAPLLVRSRFAEPSEVAQQILLRSQLAMIEELEPNLYENDLRRAADFGHTFSPELESASGYELSHGEAVALDMLLSTAIAVGLGLCEPAVFYRLHALCAAAGLPLTHPVCSPALLQRALAHASRHRGNQLNLVVPTAVGTAAFVQDVPGALLAGALDLLEEADGMDELAAAHGVAGV